ncbi:CALR protein, partial [Acrocephalus arundinaceus]|nr:CALR protein [Acrocephalus arundinaceus]
IKDPEAKKPDDWDERAKIDDPEDTKPEGEWRPQQIDNPDYKGKWVHPEIDNPEYSPDPLLYSYDSFGVIGLDLWQVRGGPGGSGGVSGSFGTPLTRPSPQVKSGTIFDNFLITDDEKLAEEIGNETWG